MSLIARSSRRLARCAPRLAAVSAGVVALCSQAAVISVQDTGIGNEYMSGAPISLPAAQISTNRFGPGAQIIRNRLHVAQPALFDESGEPVLTSEAGFPTHVHDRAAGSPRPSDGLLLASLEPVRARSFEAAAAEGTAAAAHPAPFPPYLVGQEYVFFLQNVRHYTNYACTVEVDGPSTFYLLVDNRVNDYDEDSCYDDPSFGPPDTAWVLEDGWQRVNTGLTPKVTPRRAGDFVGIDEGANGTLNQLYAVYARYLDRAGSITLRTMFDGNIYCLVVSTNSPVSPGLKPPPPSVHSAQR